jgi:hypothetical protein
MSTKFIFQPGPIVDFKYASVKDFPFRVGGRLSTRVFITDRQLRSSCSSVKLILPIWAWIFLPLSTLKETCPDLACYRACGNYYSVTSVPNLALGIRPFGPSSFPRGFSLAI